MDSGNDLFDAGIHKKIRCYMRLLRILITIVFMQCIIQNCIAQIKDVEKSNESQKTQKTYDNSKNIEPDNAGSFNGFLVDDFEKLSKYNLLRGITNLYQMPPSRIMMSTAPDVIDGIETNVLKLRFRKAVVGGPYDQGGWCGYYSVLKASNKVGADYFSADNYTYLTMWVKGETGQENFVVGLSDKRCEKTGDSVKSYEVISYLPEKKITTTWQKVKIPLEDFLLDVGNLYSLSICFERDCFPQGEVEGTVYIDNIAFE